MKMIDKWGARTKRMLFGRRKKKLANTKGGGDDRQIARKGGKEKEDVIQ